MTPAASQSVSAATPTTSTPVENAAPAAEVAARTPTVAETTPPAVASLQSLGRALEALVHLAPNWDSYGALPPTRAALEFAWHLASELVERGLPTPEIFPTRSGGVQLEWHLKHASLEWETDPNLSTGVFIFDDHRTGGRLDGELPGDIQQLADSIRRILFG